MKKVEELGISPSPWNVLQNGEIVSQEGFIFGIKKSDFGCRVVFTTEADARLIASAPELYKALYEDVTFYCEHCMDTHNATECPQKNGGDCKILEWRKLLEKAGGAE